MLESILPLYGGHAKPYLETLKENHEMKAKTKQWEEMVQKIRNDMNPKPLISLQEASAKGKGK